MTFSRVDITVTTVAGGGWQIAVSGGATAAWSMAATVHGGRGYPVGEAAAARTLADAINAITSRTSTPTQVTDAGRLLYAALVAPWWSAAHAGWAAAPPAAVELALHLDGAPDLVGLPWELVCDDQGQPLARGVELAGQVIDVIVTRRDGVPGAPPPTPAPEQPLQHPLRYLFVVGNELDTTLRAGAECMGLLRSLGPRIHERTFLAASDRLRLADAVAEFRPHVVHVICHGVLGADGAVRVQIYDRAALKVADVDVASLVEMLTPLRDGARWCPHLVVLSACSGGAPLGADGASGGAAALVRAGVPMAIGMAADVSDLASRLFTRRLGMALADGTPWLIATAQGRRAALRALALVETADWALVQTVLRTDVASHLALAVPAADAADPIVNRIRGYSLPVNHDVDPLVRRVPPLVGRHDVLTAGFDLLAGRGPAVLCLLAYPPKKQHKVGKRRVMAELAALALRAGHIPVMVMPKIGSPAGVPRSIPDLGRALAAAIKHARRLFAPGKFTLELDQVLAAGSTPIVDDLRQPLIDDLHALREAARAADPHVAAHGGDVVVFVNDVHLYGDAILPWFHQWLGGNGLGEACRIAVVTSYAKRPPDDLDATWGQLDAAIEELVTRTERARFATYALYPLCRADAIETKAPVELAERLAYQRVLLHPFRPAPIRAAKPWFLDLAPRADLDGDRNRVLRFLRLGCRGCPGSIDSDAFFELLYEACDLGAAALREANDDDLLRGRTG